jgi:hypothetical protein
MSRQIKDLAEGTIVYLDETISGTTTHVPYIYLGIDESDNARLLRFYADVAKRMNATNVASYAGCEADLWLENTETGFLSRFDAATLNCLTNTSISYTDYNTSGDGTVQLVTIVRRCFPLSYTEEGWEETAAGSEGRSYLAALKVATGQTGDNNARIGRSSDGNAVYVWMRSGYSAASFRYVSASGSAGNYYASLGNYWHRPALSVAKATSVSPEGADEIFLLPDGRRTTWDVSATMSLGQSADMPTKAKLILATHNITSATAYACNNYADDSPTWVQVGADGTVTFGTTKTADHWELGVKIEAVGSTHDAWVGEPALIVETEE